MATNPIKTLRFRALFPLYAGSGLGQSSAPAWFHPSAELVNCATMAPSLARIGFRALGLYALFPLSDLNGAGLLRQHGPELRHGGILLGRELRHFGRVRHVARRALLVAPLLLLVLPAVQGTPTLKLAPKKHSSAIIADKQIELLLILGITARPSSMLRIAPGARAAQAVVVRRT